MNVKAAKLKRFFFSVAGNREKPRGIKVGLQVGSDQK